MSEFAAGQQIGGYEILGILGKGGMGTVYKVNQTSMDRLVALKVLDPELVKKDPSFSDRFIDEARAAGRLNHPNIIGVHDVSNADVDGQTIYYFSMELVEGENFKDIIERDGAISLDVVQQVALKISDALIYAEQMNIVHRDIKPENIMITNDGLIKLADLGLALEINEAGETGTGTAGEDGKVKVMGTPRYMSPEQCRGKSVDHRTDQYCLGGTLFHMITGEPPYEGRKRKDLMRAQVLEPVPDPSELIDLPEAWRQLLMRMMAKRPEDRFPDATILKEAIRQAISGQIYTPPRRGMRRHVTRSNNNMLLYIIGGTMLLLLVLVLFANSGGGNPGNTTPDNDTEIATGPEEQSRQQARDLIERISPDNGAELSAIRGAIRKLLDYRDTLFKPSDAGYPIIQNEIERLEGTLTTRAEEQQQSLNRAYRNIETLIVSSKFQEAHDALQSISEKDRNVTRKQFTALQQQLDRELDRKCKEFIDRIHLCNKLAEVDAIIKEAKLRQAYRLRKQQIDTAAQKSKERINKELAQQARENARINKRKDIGTWREMISDLERCLSDDNYARFVNTADKARQALHDERLRAAAKAYVDIGRQAGIVSKQLDNYLTKNKPAFVFGSRNARCTGLDRDKLIVVINAGSQEIKKPITDDTLPLATFLSASLQRRNVNQRNRLISIFMNYWQHPNAGYYPNPFPQLPKEYSIKEYPQLMAAESTSPFEVSRYEVDFNNPALWQPQFAGKHIVFKGQSLEWTVTDSLKGNPGTDTESKLDFQTARFKPPIKPDSTINLRVNIKPGSLIMIGLRRAGRGARLVFNSAQFKVGAVTTDKDGKMAISQISDIASQSILSSNKDIHLEIKFDSHGEVAFSINNKSYTRYDGASGDKLLLPGSGNAEFIFQGFKMPGSNDGQLEVFEIEVDQ